MEIVRNSDIAQLVLGYLRDQSLEQVADVFCETSPYLKEERRLLKKGLKTMNLGSGTLVDIIREYCQIKSKVFQSIKNWSTKDRERMLKQNTLTGKISCLLKIINRQKIQQRQKKSIRTSRKRALSVDSTASLQATKLQDLPEFISKGNFSKHFRPSNSYFFVKNSTMTNDESMSDEETSFTSESDNSEIRTKTGSSGCDNEMNETSNEISDNSIATPTVPVLSDTILKKTEFQNVLVDNINKALQISLQNNLDKNIDKITGTTSDKESEINLEQGNLTTQLDEIIKKILDATEKDPTFDDVIHEAISLTNSVKKSTPPRSSPAKNKLIPQSESNENGILVQNSSVTADVEMKNSKKSTQVSPYKELDNVQNHINTPATKSTTVKLTDNEPPVLTLDSNLSSKLIVFSANEAIEALGNNAALLSYANLNNIQTFNTTTINDQVFIDLNSGQMSIPILTTNDNIDVPIFINGVDVGGQFQQQQKQHIEENHEVDIDTTNNCEEEQQRIFTNNESQNGTATGQTVSEPASLITKENIDLNKENEKILSMLPNVNVLNIESKTPRDHMKVPITRSSSTPRRRTSHIRVLNFGATDQHHQGQDSTNLQKNQSMEPDDITKSTVNTNDVNLQSQAVNLSDDKIVNDCSKNKTISNSNNTDFDSKKNDQAIVQKSDVISKKSKKKKKKNSSIKTAKHKSRGKNLNQNKNQENEETEKQRIKDDPSNEVNTLEQWNRMRETFSNPNWDQHLRELQAKSGNTVTKRKRLNKSLRKKLKNKDGNKKSLVLEKSKKPLKAKCTKITKLTTAKLLFSPTEETCSPTSKILRSTSSAHKRGLMTFKIPTPIKKGKLAEQNQEKSEEISLTSNDDNVDLENVKLTENLEKITVLSSNSLPNDEAKQIENISVLLETPYKTDTFQIPFTPRFIMPNCAEETPITKMMKEIQLQTSGNKQNSDLSTPNFALTPGAGLGSIEKDILLGSGSYSNRATDYSSGGSYYKPDESEDLDRHLDRLLMSERKKKTAKTSTLAMESTSRISETQADNANSKNENERQKAVQISNEIPPIKKNQIVEDVCEQNETSARNSTSKKGTSTKRTLRSIKSDLSLSDINSSEDENWKTTPQKNKLKTKKDEKPSSSRKVEALPFFNKRRARMIRENEVSKRVKLLAELKEKQLRIKTKLKDDLKIKAIDTDTYSKRVTATKARTNIEPPKKIIRRTSPLSIKSKIKNKKPSSSSLAVTKSSNKNISKSSDTMKNDDPLIDETSKDRKMDVLTALNLSAKKPSNHPLKCSTSTVFESEHPCKHRTGMDTSNETAFHETKNSLTEDTSESETSKIRLVLEDDSHDSAESVKIRNAAMVLTTLQKKLTSQIVRDKYEMMKEQKINEIKTNNENLIKFPLSDTNTKKISKYRAVTTRSLKFHSTTKEQSDSDNTQRESRTIQTRSTKDNFKNLQLRSGAIQNLRPIKMKASEQKLKKNIRKEDVDKMKTCKTVSPVLIKKPKVVLEVLTAEQLSPFKIQSKKPIKYDKRTQNEKQSNENDNFQENPVQNELIKIGCSLTIESNVNKKLENKIIEQVNETIEEVREESHCSLHTEINQNKNNSNNDKNDLMDDDDDDDEEINPYDECTVKTIDEGDEKHFIKIIYDDDSTSTNNLFSNDDKNYYDKNRLQKKSKIIINDEPHVIETSDEIELYSNVGNLTITKVIEEPSSSNMLQLCRKVVKNVPKKREKIAHISHYNSDDYSLSPLPQQLCNVSNKITTDFVFNNDVSGVNNHETIQNINNLSEEREDSEIISSDISPKPKFRIKFKDRNVKETIKFRRLTTITKKKVTVTTKKLPLIKKPISAKSYKFKPDDKEEKSLPSSLSDEQVKLLKQEDIYAVLSHLHGRDDAL